MDAARTILVVGLGNPGPAYVRNRHNAGFQCLAHYAERAGMRFSFYRFRASLAEKVIDGRRLLLARPLTYMNESGQAVGPLVRHYRVALQDLLVVYDDLDLPTGKLRLRARGGSGGHKGLDSIQRVLGTQEVPRLRLGIGRPLSGDAVDYVLSDFGHDEQVLVQAMCERAAAAIDCFVNHGIVAAMNRYNADEPERV
ncbi:MAG: aminoacyl-tRNA hydrolase [Anaerolineae bacterium]